MAVLIVVLSASLTMFALGSGRGWGVHPSLPRAFGFYLIFAIFGAIVGAMGGWVSSLIRRPRPNSRLAKWRDASRRPLRFFRRGRSETALPRPRRRRWPWVVGTLTLLLLATAFGTGVYVGRFVDRRLADATSTADRDDPNWRIDDLMANRDVVPDEENSALVVAEMVAQMPEFWPPTIAVDPSSPKTEAVKAHERISEAKDNVRLDDAAIEMLRSELNEYQDAVLLGRTLTNYTRGRHELELGPIVLDTRLPETQRSRTAARLMSADAMLRAHDGDLDGALDSCRAVVCVGRWIGVEPFMISQLVRVAIGSVAMTSARRVIGQGEPSDEALARLQFLLLDEASQPLLLYGMKGERAANVEVIRRVGTGEIPFTALSDNNPPFDPESPRTIIAPWGKLWLDNQLAVEVQWMNEAVAIARQPPNLRIARWKFFDAEIQRHRSNLLLGLSAMLPMLLMPAVRASDTAQCRYQAELGATIIVLAAERHRRKTGDWPASIAAIDPSILSDPPIDPYTGQPFRMLRRDGRLLIYSVGPNLNDEEGVFEPKRWQDGVLDDVGSGAWDISKRRQPPRSHSQE